MFNPFSEGKHKEEKAIIFPVGAQDARAAESEGFHDQVILK